MSRGLVALEGDSACRLLGAELLIGVGERGALVWQIKFKWVDCLTETFSVVFWLWFSAYSQTVLLPAGLCFALKCLFFGGGRVGAPDFIRAWVSERGSGSIADFHHLTLNYLGLVCFPAHFVLLLLLSSAPSLLTREQALLQVHFQYSSIQQVFIIRSLMRWQEQRMW